MEKEAVQEPGRRTRARRSPERRTLRANGANLDRDTAGLELIAKVDSVLNVLQARGETSAADIAEHTGEPLSSVYRLLQSLTAIGWVDRGQRRGIYRLGLLMMTVAGRIEENLDIRESALPSLRELLSATGQTSYLCVRRGDRAVCVERLEGYAVGSLALQLGGSLPLYAGAAPRALLAFLPEPEQRTVLKVTTEQADDPPRPDPASIEADILSIRRDGYAISDGDVTPGIAALGAPVFSHRGELAAAISISGLRPYVLGTQRRRNIELLTASARNASRALGQEIPA